MKRLFFFLSFLLTAAMALSSGAAFARETVVQISAKEVVASDHGQSFLLDIPIYLKGATHGAVAKDLLQVDTYQSTRGAMRSDESACKVAFLSAVKVLQQRAEGAGGDAVVDIVSTTRKTLTEDATNFRCVAGVWVVHVGLKGRVVKLK